jgi:hypothetical protein
MKPHIQMRNNQLNGFLVHLHFHQSNTSISTNDNFENV